MTENVAQEAINLVEELGLSEAGQNFPSLDELLDKLRNQVRPDWDWKEALNPACLSKGTQLPEIREAGIYNRAVLLLGQRPPFTHGLEIE